MGAYHRWTPEEDATIVHFARAGESDKAIGIRVGQTASQISSRVKYLRERGTKIPRRITRILGPKYWTPERCAELLALIHAGKTYPQMSAALGITYNCVVGRVMKMRMEGIDVPSPRRVVASNVGRHDEALRALWAEGLSANAIARRLLITRDAVIGRVHRLGLPSRPSPIMAAKPVVTSSTAAPYRPVVYGTEALPEGHPLTWGLITAGTCLEGTPYPWP